MIAVKHINICMLCFIKLIDVVCCVSKVMSTYYVSYIGIWLRPLQVKSRCPCFVPSHCGKWWEGENIKIGFQFGCPQLIDINSCQVEARPSQSTSSQIERLEFSPRLDTDSVNFDFKSEIIQLPFKLKYWKRSQFDMRTTELLYKCNLW